MCTFEWWFLNSAHYFLRLALHKNIKKYKSLKNNHERLFELDVSGEILSLSIVIFWKIWKKKKKWKNKVVFANVSKTTLRN